MSRDWKQTARTAGSFADDPAKETRRRVERAMRSMEPKTKKGKLAKEVGLLVAGPLVEHGVRLIQEKGPELARTGADRAKEKLPVIVGHTKSKAHELRVKISGRRGRPGQNPSPSVTTEPPEVSRRDSG